MKIAGILSYVGSAYMGFQRQKNHPSIQSKLEEVLSIVVGKEVTIKAAGRTDAGVNAKGQVFAFEIDRKPNLKSFKHALNRLLPKDIAVKRLIEVPDGFDPRHSSIKKEYSYHFYYGEKDPFKKETYGYFAMPGFKVEPFFEALQVFLGEHDFFCFTSKKDDKDGFIRNIEKIDCKVNEEKKEGCITLISNGFMTYQIRYMVGSAYMVSYGKNTIEDIKASLLDRNKKATSYKAPAEGLTLERVYYDERFGL